MTRSPRSSTIRFRQVKAVFLRSVRDKKLPTAAYLTASHRRMHPMSGCLNEVLGQSKVDLNCNRAAGVNELLSGPKAVLPVLSASTRAIVSGTNGT